MVMRYSIFVYIYILIYTTDFIGLIHSLYRARFHKPWNQLHGSESICRIWELVVPGVQ